MDHMNQEPLDLTAALSLLRLAREEIKRLRSGPNSDLSVDQWKMVPMDPTPEMIGAAREMRVNLRFGDHGISGQLSPFEVKEIYRLMVENSPTTPKRSALEPHKYNGADAGQLMESILSLVPLDMRPAARADFQTAIQLAILDAEESALSEKEEWVSVDERAPDDDQMVFISDGRDIALAVADRKMYQGTNKAWWNPCGFGGYEWDWDFIPTHWMPLTISLPRKS